MKSETPLIELQEISKSYPTHKKSGRAFWSALLGNRTAEGERKVLSNINLSISRGETIGIIGRNGAGKSTLLQIITGVLPATTGQKRINATIAAMLELGAGFNPEFTGLENIRLSLAMRGINATQDNIKKIVEFSELGDYIFLPIKIYSSGMYAKLAFSVNIAMTPEVLIVDEALSVGDIFFQSKCIKWMDDFRSKGGTVLFVTHDTYTVERICNRVILLDRGNLIYDGPTTDGVKLYYKLGRNDGLAVDNGSNIDSKELIANSNLDESIGDVVIKRDHITGNGDINIIGIQMSCGNSSSQNYHVGDCVTWTARIQLKRDIPSFDFGFGIRDKTGILLGGAHTFYSEEIRGGISGFKEEILNIRAEIKLDIAPGEYFVIAGAATHHSLNDWTDYCTVWDGVAFTISGSPKFWGGARLQHHFNIQSNAREN